MENKNVLANLKMNMLEILRESMWCIITLPIQMIMGAIIIGSTVRKI